MVKKEPNSTTKSDSPLTHPNDQYYQSYNQPFEDETIDLYEMWMTLWNKKWLVIATTLVAALGSLVFALYQPSIYQAEALLLPPKSNLDIQSLNIQGAQKLGVDAKKIFEAFKMNLSSRILQKKFINEFEILEILAGERTVETRDEEIYEMFAKIFKIENDGGGISISITLHDPNVAAQWVNDYVQFIDFETISMIVEQIKNLIKSQIRDIEYKIAAKRHMAKQRREDEILILEEAIIIAKSLGVKERVDATNVVQNNQLNISTSSIPLYYRGFRALNAEKQKLEKRNTDDPFISGLRDLQENLALLRSIKINEKNLHAMNVDRAAYPPKNRIKPNRRMIVKVGTTAGLFLGIFLAFFASFVMKLKEDHSENS